MKHVKLQNKNKNSLSKERKRNRERNVQSITQLANGTVQVFRGKHLRVAASGRGHRGLEGPERALLVVGGLEECGSRGREEHLVKKDDEDASPKAAPVRTNFAEKTASPSVTWRTSSESLSDSPTSTFTSGPSGMERCARLWCVWMVRSAIS